MNERDLVEKLKRIQALYVGAATAGERAAAQKAYERVHTRLEQERYVRPTTYKFTLGDAFQRRLFIALARKHGLKPYRRSRQRHTTVMLDVVPRFVDEVLWPEFETLSQTLEGYLNEVTARIIAEAVHDDPSDAAVTAELDGE